MGPASAQCDWSAAHPVGPWRTGVALVARRRVLLVLPNVCFEAVVLDAVAIASLAAPRTGKPCAQFVASSNRGACHGPSILRLAAKYEVLKNACAMPTGSLPVDSVNAQSVDPTERAVRSSLSNDN